MQQHAFAQGSPEWHAHRAQCWNASDAPAMMGQSPYKSRAQLIKEIATGLTEDVDAGTQRLFDAGHRFEALARPGAEDIVGDDLSPLIGSIDAGLSRPLAASFDGLTFMHDVAWEHKTLNDGLRASIRQQGGNANDFLSPAYRIQMEQQCMVSGAQRALFMATKWDGDTLIEKRYCWYTPDPELRAQILAGWAQFEKDVAAYQPAEAAEPAKADAMESLPAVSVRLDGALSVAGNLPAFGEALRAFIAKIPAKPATDNEFATVDAACKALKKAEEALDAAEAGALASITDVEAMRRAVADCRKLARDTRLAAEKLVDRRKAEMKEQAVLAARRALVDHVDALSAELAPIRVQMPAVDFALAIKGLRSIASMQDALDTELANGKIAADAQARVIRANRAAMEAAEAGHLFPDFQQVCTKQPDDFANLITGRKAAAQQRLEAERERIRKEEEAKATARAAAEAKAKADEQARAEREQREESERQARELQEARERAERAETAAAPITPEQGSQQVLKAEPATADATDRDAPASTSPSVGSMGAGQPADAGPAAGVTTPLHTTYTRTLRLGEIQARLAPLSITAEGLAQLGFPAHVERGLKLYWPGDFPAICRAISDHALALASAPQQLAA